MGDLSAHFDSAEFRCRHCGQVKVAPGLVTKLERLRSLIRRPLPIVSGYRCAVHNARVGGAPASKHLVGEAVDLARGIATVDEAGRAGFTGIGYRGQWAVHVDIRPGATVRFPD